MKLSEAILKGYELNDGRQCVDSLQNSNGAMCVLGAYNLATAGSAWGCEPDRENWWIQRNKFRAVYGIDPVSLNNNEEERGEAKEPFPWEHIYGMAVAIGL